MMKIKTRDFGEIEIDESTIITIPDGIIGFESVKRYTLIYPLGENTFPMWLQSVDSVEPCFVVYNPMQFYPDYRFEISDEEQAALKLDEDTPYSCLAVAIVPDDYKKTTINLRCPIVLNIRDNIAAQVMLEDYEFKYPVYASEED